MASSKGCSEVSKLFRQHVLELKPLRLGVKKSEVWTPFHLLQKSAISIIIITIIFVIIVAVFIIFCVIIITIIVLGDLIAKILVKVGQEDAAEWKCLQQTLSRISK